ncbi:unnamed protein product [Musa hybrid cultivar]
MLPRRSPPPTAKRVAVTVAETTRPRTDVALDTQLDRRRQDAQRRRQQQQWSIRQGLATERCPLSSAVISATNPTARRWSGYSNSRGPASWIMMRTPTATAPRCSGSPCRRSVPPTFFAVGRDLGHKSNSETLFRMVRRALTAEDFDELAAAAATT